MPGIPTRGFQTAPSKSNHSSALGSIWHVLRGTGTGLYKGITGLPTGAYMTARTIGHDLPNAAAHAARGDVFGTVQALAQGRTGKLAENIAKQEYNSYRHFGKGGDISGPLLDASALFTGGASVAARTGKAISAVSKAEDAARAARAAELTTKDAAVLMAKTKGVGYDKAAGMFKIPAKELKTHARKYNEGLTKGNMGGPTAPFANVPPATVLKNPAHPLFDFYAERYPNLIKNFTRARKAYMQKPTYSRPMLQGPIGDKRKTGFYVPTSPNPAFRTVRKGVEQLRPQRSAARELKKEAVRRETTQARFLAPKNIRMQKALATPPHQGALAKSLGVPMGALRMAMWLRPRYYLQNLAQTGQMLATDPLLTARSANLARQIHKVNKPLYETTRAVTGEAQAGALAMGTSPSKLGGVLGKHIPGNVGKQIRERGIQGAMGYAANVPESHLRLLSVLNELQKFHSGQSLSALTPEDVAKYFNNVRRSGVISKEHLPLRRAVENVGDFSRIFSKNMLRQWSPSEKEFMATQIPIFYPMFKALTRYGVRFPSEHAIASAGGLALGKQGKKEQTRLLGQLPFWAQYLVPRGAGDPNAVRSPSQAVFNPSNIYNLQPAADIGKQVSQIGRQGGPLPGLSLLQETGPVPGLAYGMLTGRDIQTGYPIKPFSKAFYQAHPELNRSVINSPVDFLQGLPLADLEMLASGQKPHLRSFAPGDAKARILNELIGPAFIPRTLKTKETTKQAKRETRYGKGRAPKKKSNYTP